MIKQKWESLFCIVTKVVLCCNQLTRWLRLVKLVTFRGKINKRMELDMLIIHHRMALPISRLQTGFTADISNVTRWSWHKATSQWLLYVKLDGVTSFHQHTCSAYTMQVSQCSFEDPPLHQNMERYPGTSYNSSIQPYEIYYIVLAHWWPIMAVHISSIPFHKIHPVNR